MDRQFKFGDFWEGEVEHYDDYDDNRRFNIVTSLPVGLEVWNEPANEVYPVECEYGYRWENTICVRSDEDRLEIDQFGTFGYVSNQWIFATYSVDGHPYSPSDFCEHFGTNVPMLEKGREYRMKDFTENENLTRCILMYYFIARRPTGEFVHGCSKLTKLSELKPIKPGH